MVPATDAIRIPLAAAPSLTVECVKDGWGFTALRPEWNDLLRASAADCPFLTWEWLHTWWKHLAAGSDLRMVAVRSNGQLIALAPLRLARGPVGWLSTLEFLGTGHAGSDYLDVFARRGHEADGVRAITRFVRTQKLTLKLDHLPAESLASRIAAQLSGDGWTSVTTPNGICPIIPLAGHTFDSYLGTLGSAHRANVRRRIKGLAQKFDARFELAQTASERRDALDALVRFHGHRFAGRGGSSAFFTPQLRAFHEETMRRAADRGWLRLFTLRLNDTIAAVMYGFSYNRRFYFYQHGFDDQYRAHSVGLALMGMTLRAAIEEGTDEFDMLWGVEPYKWLWAQESRPLQRIHLFPNDLAGRLQQRAVEARRGLSRLARRVLARGEASAA